MQNKLFRVIGEYLNQTDSQYWVILTSIPSIVISTEFKELICTSQNIVVCIMKEHVINLKIMVMINQRIELDTLSSTFDKLGYTLCPERAAFGHQGHWWS